MGDLTYHIMLSEFMALTVGYISSWAKHNGLHNGFGNKSLINNDIWFTPNATILGE
jgi:hypothetical protein